MNTIITAILTASLFSQSPDADMRTALSQSPLAVSCCGGKKSGTVILSCLILELSLERMVEDTGIQYSLIADRDRIVTWYAGYQQPINAATLFWFLLQLPVWVRVPKDL